MQGPAFRYHGRLVPPDELGPWRAAARQDLDVGAAEDRSDGRAEIGQPAVLKPDDPEFRSFTCHIGGGARQTHADQNRPLVRAQPESLDLSDRHAAIFDVRLADPDSAGVLEA